MGGGEVFGFGDVAGEVIEARWGDAGGGSVCGGVVADEFEAVLEDGHLVTEAPEEGVVRGSGGGAGEVREEIGAFEFPCGVRGDAGGGEGGGVEVGLDDGMGEDAGFEVGGPCDEEGDADTAFEGGAFAAAERGVARAVDGDAAHDGAAVVAEEGDERVFGLAGGGEGGAETADGGVHGGEHSGVGAALRVGDGGEASEVFGGCFEGSVDGVEGEAEKP